MRFGGISLTRNYTLQPSVNTSTRDILTDSVTMPSTVDLYIQGIRTSSQQVTPGQFTLNTAPVLSGNGSAQVVITDINGQQRVVDLALYGTNRLLTQGLHTWGLNAGWVRKDYSVRSFSYDTEFIGVGDWRYGATNQLTFESHTEQGANLNNLGAGANYLLSPTLGLVHLDLSGDAIGMMTGCSGEQDGNGTIVISMFHSIIPSGRELFAILLLWRIRHWPRGKTAPFSAGHFLPLARSAQAGSTSNIPISAPAMWAFHGQSHFQNA